MQYSLTADYVANSQSFVRLQSGAAARQTLDPHNHPEDQYWFHCNRSMHPTTSARPVCDTTLQLEHPIPARPRPHPARHKNRVYNGSRKPSVVS